MLCKSESCDECPDSQNNNSCEKNLTSSDEWFTYPYKIEYAPGIVVKYVYPINNTELSQPITVNSQKREESVQPTNVRIKFIKRENALRTDAEFPRRSKRIMNARERKYPKISQDNDDSTKN